MLRLLKNCGPIILMVAGWAVLAVWMLLSGGLS